MYNSQKFEEAAFDIYLSGMQDYESICEQLLLERYEDSIAFEILENVLNEAQRIFKSRT